MRISAAGVWAKRAGGAWVGLLAISSTVLVLSGTLTLSIIAIDLSGRTGIRHTLSGPAAELSLTATTAADPGAQDAAIREQVRIAFGDAPVSVTRAEASADSEGEPRTRWRIAPVASRIEASGLADLESGFRSIAHRIESTASTQTSSVGSTGSGLATVIAARRGVVAIGTITPVPLVLLSLSGLIALVLARGVLTDARVNETRLLRSRGGSVRGIVAVDARESLVMCLAGAIGGAAVGRLVALVLFPTSPSATAVLAPAGAVFAGAFLLNLVMSWLAARSASGAPRSGSGRRRAIASGAAVVFGLALTGLAIWRFGVGAGAASLTQDPLAVLAPAAIVLATVLVCLVVVTWWSVRIERRLFRRAEADPLVPVRDVNRRLPLLAAPTALVAIAVAVATVSASYAATWTRYEHDSGLLALGAGVRATFGDSAVISDSGDLAPIGRVRAVRGVNVAVPVSDEIDQYSDSDVTVVGVPSGALPRLIPADSSVLDAAALARSLGTRVPRGIEIPAGARSIELTLSASAARDAQQVTAATTEPDTVTTSLWLSDRLGNLVPLVLSPVTVSFGPDAPAGTATADLPSGGPWTVVAMDVNLLTPQSASDFAFRVARIDAVTGGVETPIGLPSAAWVALDSVFQDGVTRPLDDEKLGFGRAVVGQKTVGGLEVRLMPATAGAVPVVISRPFATAHGLRVGNAIDLDGDWSSFHGVVRGVIDLVPGTTSGSSVIADLLALNDGRLRASEQLPAIHQIWVGADPAGSLLARLAAAVPAARFAPASASGTDFTAVAATALWIGAAGAIVFAWIALAAVASTLLHRRSEESRMLRALGVRAGTQGRWRRAELFGSATAGLIAGVIAGLVASAVVVTPLARLATTGAPLFLPARLQVDPIPTAVAVLISAVGAAILIVAYGRLVERGSR